MTRVVIIDDQESYRIKLIKLITDSFSSQLQVVGEAANKNDGINIINKLNPDLVFLDIEMPGGTGFDLLEQIGILKFDVIFTTAHDEFAIRAIKISALDYLLKPISEKDLESALIKYKQKMEVSISMNKQFEVLLQNLRNGGNQNNQIGLPTTGGLIFVRLTDIIRCQADINYTNFFLVDKTKITVSRTLKEVESLMIDSSFIRVHDSHLINLQHIKKYIKGDGGIAVMKDGSEIDVSRRKKDELKKRLSNLKMIFD